MFEAVDDLIISLRKIDRYYSFRLTCWRIIVYILLFVAASLSIYICMLNLSFHNVNPYFGTLRLGGNVSGGQYLNLYYIILFAGSIVVYFSSLATDRQIQRKETYPYPTIDRTKGRDEIARVVTGIDWNENSHRLKLAKFIFIVHSVLTIGIYSFLLYFVIQLILVVAGAMSANILHLSFSTFSVLVQVGVIVISILISLLISRRRIRSSLTELWELKEIISQLRWFINEFEKSGFQA